MTLTEHFLISIHTKLHNHEKHLPRTPLSVKDGPAVISQGKSAFGNCFPKGKTESKIKMLS